MYEVRISSSGACDVARPADIVADPVFSDHRPRQDSGIYTMADEQREFPETLPPMMGKKTAKPHFIQRQAWRQSRIHIVRREMALGHSREVWDAPLGGFRYF